MMLDSKVSVLKCCAKFVMAITTTGALYVWSVDFCRLLTGCASARLVDFEKCKQHSDQVFEAELRTFAEFVQQPVLFSLKECGLHECHYQERVARLNSFQ